MLSVWEAGQCMSPHLYLGSQLMRPLARVKTFLCSHPTLRSPHQSQPKGILLYVCLPRLHPSLRRSRLLQSSSNEVGHPEGLSTSSTTPAPQRQRHAHPRCGCRCCRADGAAAGLREAWARDRGGRRRSGGCDGASTVTNDSPARR